MHKEDEFDGYSCWYLHFSVAQFLLQLGKLPTNFLSQLMWLQSANLGKQWNYNCRLLVGSTDQLIDCRETQTGLVVLSLVHTVHESVHLLLSLRMIFFCKTNLPELQNPWQQVNKHMQQLNFNKCARRD